MIKRISEDVWQLSFRNFGSTCYILELRHPVLIDTSAKENEEELLQDFRELQIRPENVKSIILTHSHWDHTGNLSLFPNAKIYSRNNIKELEQDFPELEIIETPGHTRDSLCILYKDILFSGDTIFHDGFIGRTDLPESIPEEMEKSLEKIKKINYRILCPGHVD